MSRLDENGFPKPEKIKCQICEKEFNGREAWNTHKGSHKKGKVNTYH